MKKIKNNSGKLILLGLNGVRFDWQPGQEIVVPDNYLEEFKSCLLRLEEIPMPPKMIMNAFGKRVPIKEKKPKEKPEAIKAEYTKEELEEWSFKKLREFGKLFDPPVTDRSKAKLIKELLVRMNED